MDSKVHYLFPSMAKDEADLPNRLRYWRKQAGLSQDELGELTGLTKQAIGHYEAGRRPISFEHGRAFARVLNCALGDLLIAEDNPWAARNDSERRVLEAMRMGEEVGAPVLATADALRLVAEKRSGFEAEPADIEAPARKRA